MITLPKPKDHVEGNYNVADQIKVNVDIKLRHTDILVDLSLTNTGDHDISDIWVDVCTSVNHLPGEPSWSNERFMGNMPLDRAIQERFWYEQIAPRNLFVITHEDWVRVEGLFIFLKAKICGCDLNEGYK